MKYIFPAVAVLLLVFVAVQAIPHAAEKEVPDDANVSDPAYNDNASGFAEAYHGLVGEAGGIVPMVIGVIATFALITRVM